MWKKIFLGLIVVVAVAAVGFRYVGDGGSLFKPTGLNDTFPDVKTFEEYIEKSQAMIREARQKTGTANEDSEREAEIVELRAPFEIKPDVEKLAPDQKGKIAPYRNGVLIAHGLNRTPREMRSVADYFAKLGFMVRITLMPGHGTVIGDLARVQHTEWLKMYNFSLESFKGEVDNLYLMGFSTGGLLTCIHALDNKKMEENNVRGIVLMSPALAIKPRMAFLLPYIFPILNQYPAVRFPIQVEENDDYGYQSVSLNAGLQIYKLIQLFNGKRKASDIKVPIFSLTTMEDLIVDVPAVKKFLYGIPNELNQHVIYTAEPIKLPKTHGHVEQINSSQEAWGGRVIGFSHSAMHVAPEDHYYGRFTQFRPCGHYALNSKLYKQCLEGNNYLNDEYRTCGRFYAEPDKMKLCQASKAFVGEASPINLKKYKPLQQLMFNNKFKYMFRALDRFLFKTGGLDARRYQLRHYKRMFDISASIEAISKKLEENYNNSDLTGTFEDVSIDLDLSSLDFLKLSNTKIQDISALSQLLELTQLVIENNDETIEDISAIGSLKNLRVLNISESKIKNVSALKNLNNLTHVLLKNNVYITKKQVDELKKALPNTDILYFNEFAISQDSLKNSNGSIETFLTLHRSWKPGFADAATLVYLQDMNVLSLKGLDSMQSLEELKI